ncbi:MAG: hypothetical protein H7A43_06500 [Verrucomicrobia bacterium]|nr:hypothetical protein [Kiritimatiellia bacterium]MCP5488283.1 hypothetical protein [Verrucomicrobiota bacterium]
MAKKTISDLSTQEILAEINRRKKSTQKLITKRAKLLQQVAEIDRQIEAAGGDMQGIAGVRLGRTRPRNTMTLPDAMLSVMTKDTPMTVSEIAAKVQQAGYQSTSRTFHTIIFQTLARESKKFKKVARGQYVRR